VTLVQPTGDAADHQLYWSAETRQTHGCAICAVAMRNPAQ
jgi:hypothetical protein